MILKAHLDLTDNINEVSCAFKIISTKTAAILFDPSLHEDRITKQSIKTNT